MHLLEHEEPFEHEEALEQKEALRPTPSMLGRSPVS